MFCSVSGYALGGGVNRFSHRAADSLGGELLPKPIEVSLVPSSSTRLMGALGRDGRAGVRDPGLPEATSKSRILAGLWMATGLPGLPLPTSPIRRTTGGQVAVAVGVREGV